MKHEGLILNLILLHRCWGRVKTDLSLCACVCACVFPVVPHQTVSSLRSRCVSNQQVNYNVPATGGRCCSAHVGVLPACEGRVALLHHLGGGPPQHVVGPAGLVVGSWGRSVRLPWKHSPTWDGGGAPEALAPPNGCCPTMEPVDLSLT